MNDSINDYRKTLIDVEQKVGEGFDKTLIALSKIKGVNTL